MVVLLLLMVRRRGGAVEASWSRLQERATQKQKYKRKVIRKRQSKDVSQLRQIVRFRVRSARCFAGSEHSEDIRITCTCLLYIDKTWKIQRSDRLVRGVDTTLNCFEACVEQALGWFASRHQRTKYGAKYFEI